MPRARKNYPPGLKAKVAVEAIRGVKTATQIAQAYDVHPNLVACWKKQALEQLPAVFTGQQAARHTDTEKDELYQQIGRLKVELDFLKKELASSIEQKRGWIDPTHPELSIRAQCDLLGLAPSSYYYSPQPETFDNLQLKREIDELYTAKPFLGSRHQQPVQRRAARQPAPLPSQHRAPPQKRRLPGGVLSRSSWAMRASRRQWTSTARSPWAKCSRSSRQRRETPHWSATRTASGQRCPGTEDEKIMNVT